MILSFYTPAEPHVSMLPTLSAMLRRYEPNQAYHVSPVTCSVYPNRNLTPAPLCSFPESSRVIVGRKRPQKAANLEDGPDTIKSYPFRLFADRGFQFHLTPPCGVAP